MEGQSLIFRESGVLHGFLQVGECLTTRAGLSGPGSDLNAMREIPSQPSGQAVPEPALILG